MKGLKLEIAEIKDLSEIQALFVETTKYTCFKDY